ARYIKSSLPSRIVVAQLFPEGVLKWAAAADIEEIACHRLSHISPARIATYSLRQAPGDKAAPGSHVGREQRATVQRSFPPAMAKLGAFAPTNRIRNERPN